MTKNQRTYLVAAGLFGLAVASVETSAAAPLYAPGALAIQSPAGISAMVEPVAVVVRRGVVARPAVRRTVVVRPAPVVRRGVVVR